MGEPDNIENAVPFLASDESRFMTAQIMVVDGAILDRMPYFAETIQSFEESPGRCSV